MKYEEIEENAIYQNACNKVKKIAKAIKTMKIKYYPNFTKISEEDQKTYQNLQKELDVISEQHGLESLKVALMGEISAKYDNNDIGNEQEKRSSKDDILLACYGATDAEQTALSKGKITQAKKCQDTLAKYEEQISLMEGSQELLNLITNYRREKFSELSNSKESVEEKNTEWENNLRNYCKPEYAENRKEAAQAISNLSREKVNVGEQTQDDKDMVIE